MYSYFKLVYVAKLYLTIIISTASTAGSYNWNINKWLSTTFDCDYDLIQGKGDAGEPTQYIATSLQTGYIVDYKKHVTPSIIFIAPSGPLLSTHTQGYVEL